MARASHTARATDRDTLCTHTPRHSVSLHSTKNRVGLSGRGAALTRPDTAHHPPNQPKSLIVAGQHELLTRWAPHSFVHPPLRADTSARPGHHATPHWVWTTRGLPPALLWNARPSSAQPGSDAPQDMETGWAEPPTLHGRCGCRPRRTARPTCLGSRFHEPLRMERRAFGRSCLARECDGWRGFLSIAVSSPPSCGVGPCVGTSAAARRARAGGRPRRP